MKPFNEHEEPKQWNFKDGQELHGDVIVEKIEDLPESFEFMKKEPMDALAYGEASGHIHKLFKMTDLPSGSYAFDLREKDDGTKYLKVIEPVVLKHQEHLPRIIPPGNYKIGIQREYDPFLKIARQVVD